MSTESLTAYVDTKNFNEPGMEANRAEWISIRSKVEMPLSLERLCQGVHPALNDAVARALSAFSDDANRSNNEDQSTYALSINAIATVLECSELDLSALSIFSDSNYTSSIGIFGEFLFGSHVRILVRRNVSIILSMQKFLGVGNRILGKRIIHELIYSERIMRYSHVGIVRFRFRGTKSEAIVKLLLAVVHAVYAHQVSRIKAAEHP